MFQNELWQLWHVFVNTLLAIDLYPLNAWVVLNVGPQEVLANNVNFDNTRVPTESLGSVIALLWGLAQSFSGFVTSDTLLNLLYAIGSPSVTRT